MVKIFFKHDMRDGEHPLSNKEVVEHFVVNPWSESDDQIRRLEERVDKLIDIISEVLTPQQILKLAIDSSHRFRVKEE